MSHTIRKSAHIITTPTGLYEANYRRLLRLVPELHSLNVNVKHYLAHSDLSLCALEQYKYTSIVSLQQSLPAMLSQQTHDSGHFRHLTLIDMELRVCHDACLAEVIGYQGKSPIQSARSYPNKHMLQVDEKRQLNLFLKDVLETSLKNAYHHKQTISPA